MTPLLGRRPSPDDDHIRKYPLRLLQPETVTVVERTIRMPSREQMYRQWYTQPDGSCVGFSCSWMMTLLNHQRYAAHWLYEQAQQIDPWTDTPPAEGTDVRSGFEVLRTLGHRRVWGVFTQPAVFSRGIEAYRWARSVDELRTSIALGSPGVLGINWYQTFNQPVIHNNEWWIGIEPSSGTPLTSLGINLGGHAICYRGASDKRQALKLTNSWGPEYPDVWIPYDVVQRLIHDDGEAGVVTDR